MALVLLSAATTAMAAKSGTNVPPTITLRETPLNRDMRAPVSFAPVAKKVTPAVVNIYSTTTIRERRARNPVFDDPFFRRFFGGDPDSQTRPRERKAEGLGSGVIVSPEGYILTANHVVDGADSVKVSLSESDTQYDAKIIGTDPPTDVAVLKIEAKKPLPSLVMGDSDKLEVGDVVLAVGNPFGVGQTVTMGIISGLGRGELGLTGYENFIQTDAAINMGNSGGALVDAEGRLVGINTAILSRTGGFQGVGFAVPCNMARYVMDRLVASGKVARGFLGISIQPLTPALAKEFRLPDESSGVLVGGVEERGAAAKAGVQEGDVVLEFNGKKVSDPRNLRLLVAQTPPATEVSLKILRVEAGRKPAEKVLKVTLGELPQNVFASGRTGSQPGSPPSLGDTLDGVEVTDLDAASRGQYKIPRSVRGALVTSVDPDSNSAEAGLRPGDVIVQINRQPVRTADEAVALSEKAKDDQVLLQVWSRGGDGATGGTRWLVVENARRK